MADNDDKKAKKKVEQNDPNGPVLKSVKPDLMCGGVHVISIWQPTIVIDSHMHIQSGRCAPLQFVQNVSAVTAILSRKWIEGLGSFAGHLLEFVFEPLLVPYRVMTGDRDSDGNYTRTYPVRKLSEEAKKPTQEIGVDFMLERTKVYETFLKTQEFYKDASYLGLYSVVMTMDMEYSHIDGYFGIKVYNPLYNTRDDVESNIPAAYWTPKHGKWVKQTLGGWLTKDEYVKSRGKEVYVKVDGPVNRPLPMTQAELDTYKRESKTYGVIGSCCDRGTQKTSPVKIEAIPILLPDVETEIYENWRKQLRFTEEAVLKNPLKLLPMFHYDPRRWQPDGNARGNDYPMSMVSGEGIYLGFKMYTAQGYRPLDPRLPILEDFYGRCCINGIPIMNHGTPGGAATFEMDEYKDFEHPNDTPEDLRQKQGKSTTEYFQEHFVSPEAWKTVLDGGVQLDDYQRSVPLQRLRLCLAHFGGPTKKGMEWNRQIIDMIKSGKYPNLYTDISSSFADSGFRKDFKSIITGNPEIKDRILFGTDWFLTFFYGMTVSLNLLEYCKTTKECLDAFDTSLWPAFTQYNPYRFYRLDKQIDRIARNIIAKRQAQEIKELPKFDEEDIKDIQKEAAYIKVANQGHVIYEETPCTG